MAVIGDLKVDVYSTDVHERMAAALERIADALERQAPATLPKPHVFGTTSNPET